MDDARDGRGRGRGRGGGSGSGRGGAGNDAEAAVTVDEAARERLLDAFGAALADRSPEDDVVAAVEPVVVALRGDAGRVDAGVAAWLDATAAVADRVALTVRPRPDALPTAYLRHRDGEWRLARRRGERIERAEVVTRETASGAVDGGVLAPDAVDALPVPVRSRFVGT